ncbi:hypothetical protein HYPSUDRAFT_59392 [Hypholoma sublateritium FD-334 SS-4]|uniref:Uncharacterized protein n=1 Tax=Hypholoma sublateritium (strain FD-334 SS-4) TaxID=945553 RepID=A0A0D2KIF2_HYPSF|nr:hypothetical protein HYPSUDRAFT_59392 [Hypholoma sublateritium FD-334 SS-4]
MMYGASSAGNYCAPSASLSGAISYQAARRSTPKSRPGTPVSIAAKEIRPVSFVTAGSAKAKTVDSGLADTVYSTAVAKMKSVVQREEYSATITSVSEDIFSRLQDEDGWSKLKLTYNTKTEVLIIEFPIFPHEVVSDILYAVSQDRQSISTLHRINDRGCAQIRLEDGIIKSPDFGHFDPNISQISRGLVARYRKVSPTVIWEIGFSQRRKDLECATAHSVAASGGNTNLGIALDVGYKKDKALQRLLTRIIVSLWTVVEFLRPDKK